MPGGGALGAFQAGVYEALHEAGIEPDWVIGTSIGAINAAIIAGNPDNLRLQRLREFWDLLASGSAAFPISTEFDVASAATNLRTLLHGVPGFFTPNIQAWAGPHAPLGVTAAAWYSTAPLRRTLGRLVDPALINGGDVRLTLGAVNVHSGRLRYFDSRDEPLSLEHVMASGALPPAFPAVVIQGEPYWDGGIHSNTPLEAVFDDTKRRDSVIFAAQLWQQTGEIPISLCAVMTRHKDIQYSSRADGHIARQRQLHHLRHIVRELGDRLPESAKTPAVRELIEYGCGTVMHVVPIRAPQREGEDHTKDIDFTPGGIRERWEAGRDLARHAIAAAPWGKAFDPMDGVVLHEPA